MKIGKHEINAPALAPMAGVNCTAFRLLCKEAGAGLIYTQMYHADFICHKLDKEGFGAVKSYIDIQESERPVAIQLVGHNPENIHRAAKIIEPIADIIDINLGCCDPAIIKSGAGAHYLRYPEKIPAIFEGLKSLSKPYTAKIRIGYDSQSINCVEVAAMLEKLGCQAIAVHGRVATQKYGGKANWQAIADVKKKISIPVIGNGDVKDWESMQKLVKSTGCDQVMVGRMAMGYPGIFAVLSGRKPNSPTADFLRFAQLHSGSFSELRTHALWFSKRARLGPKARDMMMRAMHKQELISLFSP